MHHADSVGGARFDKESLGDDGLVQFVESDERAHRVTVSIQRH